MSEVKIPEGYKQTEVGVIPKDWEVSNIKNISLSPTQNGLFYEPQRKGKGVPLINVSDMYKSAPINVSLLELFDATPNEMSIFKVNSGDLFFTRSSIVPSGIAFCNIFESKRNDVVFDSHLIRVQPNKNLIDSRYLYLNCISQHARTALISEAKTATMTTIDQAAINRCPVLIPPRKEQTAIATALSDVDDLIGSLEKLITKKEAIKTATMQQLLSGKTRLPEFAIRDDGIAKGFKQTELGWIPEDWEVVQMGDIGKFGRGRVISNREIDRSITDSYPVYSSQTSNDGIMGYIDTFDFEGEYITWTTDGVNAGKVFYRNGKFNCTNVCGSIKVYNQNTNFIALAMSIRARKYVSTNLANPKLMNGVAKKVLISTPTLIEEQTAIATILSDMDSEIQALQKRLDKTRDIKQGMMQQLLTGKVRLVHSDSSSTHPSADNGDCLA